MNSEIIDKLNSEDEISLKTLSDILSKGKIKENDLRIILSISNVSTISEFLLSYDYFDTSDKRIIHDFIIANLDHNNRLFVSDLIELANEWELNLPYSKCISFIPVFQDDNTYVQLAVIDYIWENLKLAYISTIYPALEHALNNTDCNQSVQIKSAFMLYRISGNRKFLSDVVDLVVNGDDNEDLLKNILELEYNDEKYFSEAVVLKALLPSISEKSL